MVDAAIQNDLGEDLEFEVRPRKGGLSGKKLVLFILLPLLLLGAAGAGLFASGSLDRFFSPGDAAPSEEGVPFETVFYDLPEMLVNLSPSGRKTHFLKITVSLELNEAAQVEQLEKLQPRIIDSFQVYLRELRIDDLAGSAGIQKLREELLVRVNTAASPARISDVLFKEMLVQ